MDQSMQLIVNSTLLLIAAIFACVLLARVGWIFIKSSDKNTLPVICLLLGFCLESVFVKQPYFQVGLQIYPNDLISVFVLLSVIVRFTYRPLPLTEGPFLLWLAFGGTIFISLIVGLDAYGKYAGTEVRPFFYIWTAGLYCCAVDFSETELRRIGRWCSRAACVIIAIAACIWVGVEAGLLNSTDYIAGGNVVRPVGSHHALFVAAVALVQTMAWLRGTGVRHSGWYAAAFLIFVVILQHRSVWIATLIGLFCVMLLERRHISRRLPALIGFVFVIGLVTTLAIGFGYLDEFASGMVRSTLSMTDRGGTFAARIDGWDRLVEPWFESSAQTIFFGYPFGRGYTRLYNGQLIEFAPHNFYLDLVLRVGVIGTVLFLLAKLIAVFHALRVRCSSEFEYLMMRGLGVGLVMSLVYYVAYPSFYILGGATGFVLAHIIRQRRIRNPQYQPPQLRSARQPLSPRAAE